VAYGEYAMKKSSVFEWHRRFEEGPEDVQDDPTSGQPKTQKTDYEFIAQGQTVNQQCYLEVLTSLRESVRRKRPELWPDKWILYHDNDPAYDALRVREFMAKKSITKMDHPPYSPDLAPCDFWLFPKLKNFPKEQRFADIPDIQCNVTTLIRGIPEKRFSRLFR
jgi:histone-lysine N-methyltransferase SETMAR